MKIYETNAGLGYGQLAYLVRMKKSEMGMIIYALVRIFKANRVMR